MGKLNNVGHALYSGRASVDFIGRRYTWYAISAVLVVVSLLGLFVKGLNLGIEFEGGVEYVVAIDNGQGTTKTVDKLTDAITKVAADDKIDNAADPIVNTSNTQGGDKIRVQTEDLTQDQANKIQGAIKTALSVTDDDITRQTIGPSWGKEVANRAIKGLIVFLILVVLLIAAYTREWKMSVAAVVALAHDLLITTGVYALSGFEVTPATVTGLLTILGFSLYDTVVVFDKVRENTKNLNRTRQTFREAANLAVNQTLVRSINTSIVALLPVGALLYAGVFVLGSGALKDLALALFVGMAVGAYSSIFLASPLFVQLKELEPGIKKGDARNLKHRVRREVDPFAHVPTDGPTIPAYEQGPVIDGEVSSFLEEEIEVDTGMRAPTTPAEARPSARPLSDTSSANRPQPSRKPRSKRK